MPDRPQPLSWRKRLTLKVVPPMGSMLIRTLGRLLPIHTEGHHFVDGLHQQGRNVIIAFWHGRQLMMPLAYRGKEAHILISQHRDGELICRIVEYFGFRSVRGSSTRGGIQALRRLIRLGQSGVDLVMTPDGPKGPRQIVQSGVIHLAKFTGLPIVPLTFSCTKKNSSEVGIALCCPTR